MSSAYYKYLTEQTVSIDESMVLESMGLNDLRETSQSSLDTRFGLLLLH